MYKRIANAISICDDHGTRQGTTITRDCDRSRLHLAYGTNTEMSYRSDSATTTKVDASVLSQITRHLTFHLLHPTFKLIPDMNKTQSTSRLSSGAKTLGHATQPVSKPSSGAPDQVTCLPLAINPGTSSDASKATKVLSKPTSLPHGFGGDTSSPSSSFHFKGPSL